MKYLTMFAVLVMLAGGTALAQQDMGNSSVGGATYTTGIVESLDSSQLTLRDESDQVLTLLIVKGTVNAKNHPVGSRVRVDFHNNEAGQMVADEIQGPAGRIRTADSAVQEETVAHEQDMTEHEMTGHEMTEREMTEPTTEPDMTATADARRPSTAPQSIDTEEPVVATRTRSTLPRTASSIVAIGLLGLLCLSGAMVLRFSR